MPAGHRCPHGLDDCLAPLQPHFLVLGEGRCRRRNRVLDRRVDAILECYLGDAELIRRSQGRASSLGKLRRGNPALDAVDDCLDLGVVEHLPARFLSTLVVPLFPTDIGE